MNAILNTIPKASLEMRNELAEAVVLMGKKEMYSLIDDLEKYIRCLVDLARVPSLSKGDMISDVLLDLALRAPSIRPLLVRSVGEWPV